MTKEQDAYERGFLDGCRQENLKVIQEADKSLENMINLSLWLLEFTPYLVVFILGWLFGLMGCPVNAIISTVG